MSTNPKIAEASSRELLEARYLRALAARDMAVWRERSAAEGLMIGREPVSQPNADQRIRPSISPYEPTLNGHAIGRV